MRLRVVVAILLPMMIFCVPAAAARLEAHVVDGANGKLLAGVHIEIKASGQSKSLPQKTSDYGKFSIDPTEHFTAEELDTYVITLIFSKEGYKKTTLKWVTPQRGNFQPGNFWSEKTENLTVELFYIIDEPVFTELQKVKSKNGTTLYMMPYLPDEPESKSQAKYAKKINRNLMKNLRRGINPHLQSLETDGGQPEVGLRKWPSKVEIGTDDMELIRSYGKEINALAVFSGSVGAVFEGSVGDEEKVDMLPVDSHYSIIPEIPEFQISFDIEDNFSLKQPLARHLHKHLDKLWKHNTVLALSLMEIKNALIKREHDEKREGLERARDYLIAERKRVGPDNEDNEDLVKDFDRLMAIIEELQN